MFPALRRAGDFIFMDNAARANPQRARRGDQPSDLAQCAARRPLWAQRHRRPVGRRCARSVALLINAYSPSEICFGMNATSFIRLVSLGISQMLQERDEIVITDMDHDANIATWLALDRPAPSSNGGACARMAICMSTICGRWSPDRTRLVACTVTAHLDRLDRRRRLGGEDRTRRRCRSVPRQRALRAARADRRAGLGLRVARLFGLQEVLAAYGLPVGALRDVEAPAHLPRRLHPRRAALQG